MFGVLLARAYESASAPAAEHGGRCTADPHQAGEPAGRGAGGDDGARPDQPPGRHLRLVLDVRLDRGDVVLGEVALH